MKVSWNAVKQGGVVIYRLTYRVAKGDDEISITVSQNSATIVSLLPNVEYEVGYTW